MPTPKSPIAITGAACLLPGAPDVETFAALVLEGRDAVGEPPEGRFGVPNRAVAGEGRDQAWSLAGGYVAPGALDAAEGLPDADRLDLLTRWLLHCSRRALRAGAGPGGLAPARTGAVFGNLSFPTDGMARWGEGLATGADPGDPRNQFMSGLPAALVGQALGLDAGTTCLDAACASSLYALELACEALRFGRADRMLAGAVQRADSLFLHVGFCRLGAMSRTGQSRPFHRDADGLVPAEGCVVFSLRRLEDAVAAGEPILGVIRGIGLCNDGRARGLLAPSSEGQVRAMRAALGQAGWSPAQVQLFECHATGTPTGDKTELESLRAVYPGGALGSLKSNLGHLITTAGAAGLLKVLLGMRAGVMPPTLHADTPLGDLGGFELLHAPRPWAPAADGVRRAAVSAFGFGGNDAHLLVEDWTPGRPVPAATRPARTTLAVLALAERRGGTELTLPLTGLRFPPADLQASLAQQVLLLQLGREAYAEARIVPDRTRVGVYVGMACDGLITRWGLRWRALHGRGASTAEADSLAPALRAEHVVGTMPNIVANRLGVQLDAAGPGFTVSAEELSGLRALDAAWDALSRGELDLALVGAVDLASDPRAVAARAALGRTEAQEDGGVMFAIVREADAGGAPVLATLHADLEAPVLRPHPPRFGAADALLRVADAIHRGGDHLVQVRALGGEGAAIAVRGGAARPRRPSPPTGPTLSLPMHPTEKPRVRVLPPAPALVPVAMSDGRNPPAVPVAGVAMRNDPPGPLAAPATGAVAAGVEVLVGSADGGWEPGFAAWRRAVGGVHAAFLDDQANLHAAFLHTHGELTRSMLALAQAGAVVAESEPVPVQVQVQPAPSAPAPAPAVVIPAAPPAAPAAARPAPPPPSVAVAPTVVAPAAPAPVAEGGWRPGSELPGPRLSRAELEMGANGSITTLFGPDFAELDAYRRVVRMPEPPLLLADRVLGIEGPARKLGRGRIVTETDLRDDAWYLHEGRMPGGLMIESGQADLLLGSWQGIDFLNKSERIYRLLGCTLTYKGELPKVGETLRYDIRIDQHAKLGDIRMFFFRYDCHVGGKARLSVKEGQAGFFSDAELDNSGGCIWDAATHEPGPGHVDAPAAIPATNMLERPQLEAMARGDVAGVLGPAFRRADTHTWTPGVPADRMLLMDRLSFDLGGGPWKRGYLRAELDIRPDLWFFHGHFFNDPCMPGTLMFDGCLQAMYQYLVVAGVTLRNDGWRFEPIKDTPFKLVCRGQVTPRSKKLVYEVFVTELHVGPRPRLVAQVLCTVDGLKCFHADPMGVELVPDWPLERPEFVPWLHGAIADDGAEYGWAAMLACAWGRPTDAFGPMYAPYDGPRRVARLPGPPYHFMSRVRRTEGKMGGQTAGTAAVVEYDVPVDAWYFGENGHPVMPFCVLLEAALQPCGWLASWTGCALGEDDFLFRNLDGTCTVHREVTPRTGRITTTARLERISRSGGMVLVSFAVAMVDAVGPVLEMKTVFGFFPPAAFENQVGVGSTEAERARLAARAEPVSVPRQADVPAMAGHRLQLLDRAWRAADGWYRGEMNVRSDQWFFAAHFYQDPVQPGSLGIEALLQLLQVAMVDSGRCVGLRRPRFEPVANGEAMVWKYRGQVVPENGVVQTEVRVLESKTDDSGMLVSAEGHLWVDGKKIYTMPRFAMRVVEDERPATVELAVPVDHRPTWTVPAAAMMTMAMHALTATGAAGLEEGAALRWLTFPDGTPRRIELHLDGDHVVLGPRDAPYFRARAAADLTVPELPPLESGEADEQAGDELYRSGALFHGPGFQAVDTVLARGSNGARALLREGLAPDVLLDGMTHVVPHDDMGRWFDVPDGHAAYPARLRRLVLRGGVPSGTPRVEARALGVHAGRPRVGLWLYDADDTCVVYVELDEVLLPKGPIGRAAPSARRAFLQGVATPGVALSRIDGDTATLSRAEVLANDWLPGTVAAVYGTDDPAELATRELAAATLGGHPAAIRVDAGVAWSTTRPLRTVAIEVTAGNPVVARRGTVRDLDLAPVTRWWRRQLDVGPWPGEAVLEALAATWLAELRFEAPAELAALRGPVLFLANHESYLESVLFTAVVAAHTGRPIRALAKVEHQTRWLGKLHAAMTSYPGHRDPPRIVWFDQDRPASLRPVLDAVPRTVSLLAHVEGTRQTEVGAPIGKISSIWPDLALERGWPVVPVAFRGGVAGGRTDLPVAPQVHIVGRPIPAHELGAMAYAERRQHIASAIDALGADVRTPAGVAPTVAAPGRRLVEVLDAAGALGGADAAWAARVRSIAEG